MSRKPDFLSPQELTLNENSGSPWVAIILGVLLVLNGNGLRGQINLARWDTVNDLTMEMYGSYGLGILFICIGIRALLKEN